MSYATAVAGATAVAVDGDAAGCAIGGARFSSRLGATGVGSGVVVAGATAGVGLAAGCSCGAARVGSSAWSKLVAMASDAMETPSRFDRVARDIRKGLEERRVSFKLRKVGLLRADHIFGRLRLSGTPNAMVQEKPVKERFYKRLSYG